MRRMWVVAFLSALLVAVAPAFAQRGAGHPSGGFSGGHVGGFGGGSMGHGFSGGSFSGSSFGHPTGFAPHSFATPPQFTSTAPTHSIITPGSRMLYGSPYGGPATEWRNGGRGDRDRDGRDRDGRGGYRSPYRGFGGYPYVYSNSWELLPWDLSYSDSTGYNGYDAGVEAQQPAASVGPMDDGYRPDYQPGYEQPGYKDYGSGNPPAAFANSTAIEPQLTLIFNDGHQQGIHNYVLTSDAVIVLDQAASGRQQRIPLASLNVPATEQAAQQAGLDFTPPA
jgi:hypothetical protein